MATGRIGVTPTLGVRWSKAPTGGTTSLSGLDDNSVSLVYSVGYEQVYRNGVLLSRTNDYTATTGNSITLIDATITGDIIEVFANELVPLTDAISKGQFTAKGALLSATAASTPGVLTVGSNDQVLTADSTTSTGLKWAAPAAASFVGCRVYKSAGGGGQTISNNTATALTFDSEEFDTDSFHSTVTNTSRITIPAGKGGKYLFEGFCILTSGTGDRNLDFNVNGSTARYLYQIPGVSSAVGFGLGGAAILNLSAGDYVELIVYQSSGTNRTTGTGVPSVSMACTYLGA